MGVIRERKLKVAALLHAGSFKVDLKYIAFSLCSLDFLIPGSTLSHHTVWKEPLTSISLGESYVASSTEEGCVDSV